MEMVKCGLKHGDRVVFSGLPQGITMFVQQILTCDDTGFEYADVIIMNYEGKIMTGHFPAKILEPYKERSKDGNEEKS